MAALCKSLFTVLIVQVGPSPDISSKAGLLFQIKTVDCCVPNLVPPLPGRLIWQHGVLPGLPIKDEGLVGALHLPAGDEHVGRVDHGRAVPAGGRGKVRATVRLAIAIDLGVRDQD